MLSFHRQIAPLLMGIALIAAEGDPDPTFGTVRPDNSRTGAARVDVVPGGAEDALCGVIQGDGKIIVGGWATVAGNTDLTLFRLATDGSLDTGFGTGGSVIQTIGSGTDQALALALQSDGRIVVAGVASNGSDGDLVVLRYTAGGVLDTTFGTNGIYRHADGVATSSGSSVLVQADGTILIGGQVGSDAVILRLTSGGALDTTFGVMGAMRWAGDNKPFTDLKTDSQGRVLAICSMDTPRLVRLTPSGLLDSTFTPMLPNLYSYNSDRVLIPQAADGWLIGSAVLNGYSTAVVSSTGVVTPNFGTRPYYVAQPDGKLWGSTGTLSYRSLAQGTNDEAMVPVNSGVGYANNPGIGYYSDLTVSGRVYAIRTLLDAPRKRILTIGRASGYYLGSTSFSDYAQAVGAIVYDTPPVATITRVGTVGQVGSNAVLRQQIVFSEEVTGFDLADLSVDNGGSLSNLQASPTNNRTWTVDVQGPANGAATTVSVAAGAATDSLGNSNAAASLATTLAAGTPVLAISPNGSVSNLATLTFTFTFSADVVGFVASDITVSGGTAGTFSAVDARIYTLTVTPNAGPLTVSVSVPANAAATAGGIASTQATASVTSDRASPTATLALVSGQTTSGANPIPVTITFNEAVTGLALSDVNVTNGSASNLAGSGATYTIDITPAADGNITVALASGSVSDLAGNASGSGSLTFTSDRTVPVATVTALASGQVTSNALAVSWAFESLTRYPQAEDVILVNGTISGSYFYSSGGYFTITVIDRTQPFGFTIPASSMKDAAGNMAQAITRTWTIPTPAQARAKEGVPDPTFGALMPNGLRTGGVGVRVPADDQSATGAAVQTDGAVVMVGYAQITGNYDLVVTRVTVDGELDTTFGSLGLIIQPIGSGLDKAYDVALQADGKIVVVGVASNQSNETNADGVVLRYTTSGQLDTTFGTGGIYRWSNGAARTLVIQPSGRIVVAGRQANRAVLLGISSLGVTDSTFGVAGTVIGAENQQFVTLAGDDLGRLVATDNVYRRGVLRCDVNGQVDAGFAPIMDASNYNGATTLVPRDGGGWLFSSYYPSGTSAGPSPEVNVQGDVLNTSIGSRPYAVAQPDGRLWGGWDGSLFLSRLDGALDDSVSDGSTNGQVSTPLVGWSGTSVPQANISSRRLVMDVPRGRLLTIGFASYYSVGGVYHNGYAMAVGATVIDAAPTVSMTSMGSVGTSGSNALQRFRIVFSEPVTGFDLTDLTIDNGGTLNNLQPLGSRSYTVDAAVPMNGAVTTLTLASSAVTDSTGNTNASATVTTSVTGGTPVLAITPNGLTTGAGSITATFTFSVPVTGFDVADITVVGATKGSLTAVDAQTSTLSLFPTGGTITVTVPSGAAQASGILSTAATATIISDRAPPTLDISLVRGGTAAAGSPVPVRLSFNEPVTGFSLASVTVTNGTASNLQGSGASYTIDVAPLLAGTVAVTVAAGAAVDGAGNVSGGGTFSFASDPAGPVVTVTSAASGAVPSPQVPVYMSYGENLVEYPRSADVVLVNATLVGSTSFGQTQCSFSVQAIDPAQAFGFSIPASRFRDAAGNRATTSVARTWTVLTQPTLTVGASGLLLAQEKDFILRLAFDRGVSGLEVTDLVAPGVTLGTPTGGPEIWNIPASVTADGTFTISLPSAVVTPTNRDGSWTVTVATQTPVVQLPGVPASGAYVPGPVTVNWQVIATGGSLAESALILTNASSSAFSSSGRNGTVRIAPADPSLPFGVTIPAGIWTGASGLTNAAVTRQWTLDAIPAQVLFTPVGGAVVPMAATITFTLTPTEPLFVGLVPLLVDQLGLSCAGGTVTSTTLEAGSALTVVVTREPGRSAVTLGVTGMSRLGGAVVDRAGTALVPGSARVILDDGQAPVLVSQDPPTSLASSELMPVSFRFSEDLEDGPAVTDSLEDLVTVTGASLASARWSGPDLRLQLAARTAATITVTVAAGAGQDLTGLPTPAVSGTWSIDSVPPTITGTLVGSGQQFTLTIQASEPLAVDADATPWTYLDIQGGLLGVITTVDAQTWTAPVWAMPNAGTLAVVVRYAMITDLSGNDVELENLALAEATVTTTPDGGTGLGSTTSGPAVAAGTPVPALIPYQGRLTIDGVAANGSVNLKFALVDSAGVQRWSNDGTASGEPAVGVTAVATDGLVATYLGDTTAGQVAIAPGVFRAPDLRLRVWVGQAGGFTQVSPDLRLGASGYALMSALAGPDAVDSAAIHDGAITTQDAAPVTAP